MVCSRRAAGLVLAWTLFGCPDAPQTSVEAAEPASVAQLPIIVRSLPPDASTVARRPATAATTVEVEALPLYGAAANYVSTVFAEESSNARPIGYMRRGAKFRARPGPRGPGCRRWYEVEGGGFVCDGGGVIVGVTPQSFDPSPTPPDLESNLPYRYAYTQRDDVPQFWALPSLAEEAEAAELIAQSRATAETAAASLTPEEVRLDAVEAPPPPGTEPVSLEVEAPLQPDPEHALPEFLRGWMLRGFYVGVDRTEESALGRRFARTVRGAYVRADALMPNDPPTGRGVVLGGEYQLPVAIVWRRGSTQYTRMVGVDRVRANGPIARHAALPIEAERRFVQGREYVESIDGTLVREPAVRVARAATRLPVIPRGAKWIHIRLSTQTLVAYEGDNPVYATLVSTGKEGFETPTGVFRIQSKHVSTTMDDPANPEGAYSIEDVPWTMYFDGSYALHGAFWHYAFGAVRSHGCVNLAPADARWLFMWATPTLTAAWHGVFATRANAGTWVWIEP